MANKSTRTRTLDEWIWAQSPEDMICVNRFHDIVRGVYEGAAPVEINPNFFDMDDYRLKAAQLMKAQIILLGGDVIYVREGDTLHTLGDSLDLMSYYMHADSREARKAMDILETNFQGYFPIDDGLVLRDVIRLDYPDGSQCMVNLKTLDVAEPDIMHVTGIYPEFGVSEVIPHNYGPIKRFFSVMNDAIGEPFFLEKTMLYHFNQPFREKSHVLVGGGGNGKSMYMGLIKRLFGDFALTDAPQPNFTGHAAAVIAYSFIGKRIITFNDVGDPSSKFLEWMKRMITGNLEVKTPSGSWLSVPCNANFLMETNHAPQVLSLEAHRRRFIIREFDPGFRLKDYLSNEDLDKLGDRGDITAADLVNYMLTIKNQVDDWAEFGAEPEDLDWCEEVAE